MKKTLSIFSLAILAACGSPEAPTGDLAKLVLEKDSLVGVRSALNAEIAALDAQISKLDTTVRYDVVTSLEVVPQTFLHYFDVFGTVEADKSINLYPIA